MSTDSTQPTATETNSTIHHTDLTAFQLDLLAVTARLDAAVDQVYGLKIKRGLEDIHGEEINHGRLYPNLDELAEDGLIVKESLAIDNRTNSYSVSDDGYRLLAERRAHLSHALDGGA